MDTMTGLDHAERRALEARLASRAEDVSTEELDRLARDHWWRGEVPEAVRLDELVHHRLVAAGRVVEGAERALRVSLQWGTRGDITLAMAWLSRADRLLRDQPVCVVHGYAEYARAAADLDFVGEPTAATDAAKELAALARRFPDPTLECFALALDGMAAVRSGDSGGFAALDEAMIPVLGGQVDPLWGGDIFCSVIHLCEALGDLARMRSWTDSLAAWSTPLSTTFLYAGVTRIHQLQLLRAEGEWDQVERELAERSAGLADAHGWLAGAGFYELGEVHRLRGRNDEAVAAYSQARAFGIDPQPGEAELWHATGRTADALTALHVSLAERGRLDRARVIGPAVDIALAAGDTTLAASLVDELEQTASFFGTPGLHAAAAQARAALLTEGGEHDAALARLEDAATVYRHQRSRHATARVHEAMSVAHRRLGHTDQADAAEATARAIYQHLGAQADLRRLDA
ncbi:MAG: hypothetical protein ACRDOM_00275, partial [Nocardioides sp.]